MLFRIVTTIFHNLVVIAHLWHGSSTQGGGETVYLLKLAYTSQDTQVLRACPVGGEHQPIYLFYWQLIVRSLKHRAPNVMI